MAEQAEGECAVRPERRRAGASQGEPRTEPPSEAAERDSQMSASGDVSAANGS